MPRSLPKMLMASSTILAVSCGVGASRANADLMLTLEDTKYSGSANTSNPVVLTITDSSANVGSFTLTNAAKNASYNFYFDGSGTATVVTTDASGNATGTFTSTSANTIGFRGLVGAFNVNALNASQTLSAGSSTISDTSGDVASRASFQAGEAFSITTTSTAFTVPPLALLTSSLSMNTVGSITPDPTASVSLTSTVNTTSTSPITATYASPNPTSSSIYVNNTGPSPYSASNSVTLTNFTGGDGVDFTAGTTVLHTPEPSTWVMAFAALPAGLVFWLRRKARS